MVKRLLLSLRWGPSRGLARARLFPCLCSLRVDADFPLVLGPSAPFSWPWGQEGVQCLYVFLLGVQVSAPRSQEPSEQASGSEGSHHSGAPGLKGRHGGLLCSRGLGL